MFDDVKYLIVIPFIWVVCWASVATIKWIDKSEHRDFETVATMDFSEMHVGQSVDLQKYSVSLKSGNKNILQVGTSDNDCWYSDSKLVLTAVAKGDAVLTISDEGSNDYKVVKIHVE